MISFGGLGGVVGLLKEETEQNGGDGVGWGVLGLFATSQQPRATRTNRTDSKMLVLHVIDENAHPMPLGQEIEYG